MEPAEIGQENWIEFFRAVLHYCVPPIESTPLVNVGALVAIAVGLFLSFRSGKFERFVVCAFALVFGGWLGHRLALLINSPGPITVAVAGLVLSILAYKTFRWWLAAGSVLVLFGFALTFQLGRGDVHNELLRLAQSGAPLEDGRVQLPSTAEEQLRNLHQNPWNQIEKVKAVVVRELKDLGPVGWLVPVAAAVLGGVLAYWALRAFVVIWLGLIGANAAVLGGITVLSANWPQTRDAVFGHPEIPAGIAVGLWLLGLILQAKDARFPKKKKRAGTSDNDSPK